MPSSRDNAATRVMAIGECMIELRDDASSAMAFAGDTLNTTTYLRRLLSADEYAVLYATALGDDPISERMIAAWGGEGIDTSYVRRLPGELPGLYLIRTDASGEREFFYWRSAAAARKLLADGYADTLAQALGKNDLLYTSGISFAILPDKDRKHLLGVLQSLRKCGTRIAYDTNYRARLWNGPVDARKWHERILPNVDILITSLADEAAMFDECTTATIADRLNACNVAEWVIRVEPGVTVSHDGGEAVAETVATASVADTTGAGDSFDAAYLAARLSGCDTAAAIAAGHRLAGIVIQHAGAIIPAAATPSLRHLCRG